MTGMGTPATKWELPEIFSGPPHYLLALACKLSKRADQDRLLNVLSKDCSLTDVQRIAIARELFQKAKVFDQAYRLVEKHQERCEEIVRNLQPEPLRRLLSYLIDSVLERPQVVSPPLVALQPTSSLPVVSRV